MAVLRCAQSQMERAFLSTPHVLMVLQEKSKFLHNLLPNFMQYVSEWCETASLTADTMQNPREEAYHEKTS